MDRPAPDLDPEPQDAGIGAHQHLLLRLGDQHRVGAVAAQMGHQGAVAGRFLFHHRLQRHGGRRLEPDAAERVEGEQVGGVPRLHVGAAAAVEPVALHHRLEGRVCPEVGGACRHHVDMGLEDQRAPPLLPRPVDADDDRRLGMLGTELGAARMRLDLRPVHREAVHGVAALAEGAEDEVLDRLLLAAGRGEAHQRLRVGDLRGKILGDCGDDAVAQGGIQGHRGLLEGRDAPCIAGTRRRRDARRCKRGCRAIRARGALLLRD